MALILNIESSTTMCSVALGRDGKLLDAEEVNEDYSHAEKLAPFADLLLRRNDIAPDELDAVAVSKGPGSYTGLRIGVSLAKGLCFGLSKPLIAVPTLQFMCLHPRVREQLNFYKDLLLCPMLDARRMEVYTAVYDAGLMPVVETHPKVLDNQSFAHLLEKEAMLFFGPGAEKFRMVVSHPGAMFVEGVWPSARQMVPLSEMRFSQGAFEDVAYFEPFYLKEFMSTQPRKDAAR